MCIWLQFAMKQVTNYTTICVKAWYVTEKHIHSFVIIMCLAGSSPAPHWTFPNPMAWSDIDFCEVIFITNLPKSHGFKNLATQYLLIQVSSI
jgi:hypothetical protein